MKLHTSKSGDQFLLDHIRSTTKWSNSNRRRKANSTDVMSRILWGTITLVIFLSLLVFL